MPGGVGGARTKLAPIPIRFEEPPSADPLARWCGAAVRNGRGYPIYLPFFADRAGHVLCLRKTLQRGRICRNS
jgi:hypothetical protein